MGGDLIKRVYVRAILSSVPVFSFVFMGCASSAPKGVRSQRLPAQVAQSANFSFARPFEMTHFWKGNLHTHSRDTDGDSPIEVVVQWYKTHGYNFVAVTDHNLHNTGMRGFQSFEVAGTFRVMKGEEATYDIHSTDPGVHFLPIHVNALCSIAPLPAVVVPRVLNPADSVRPTLMRVVNAIRAAGALAQINHPNLHDAFGAEDILAATPATTPLLFEVGNQHFMVNNEGYQLDARGYVVHPFVKVRSSTEEMWDEMLQTGRKVYGTATDDLHDLKWTVLIKDNLVTPDPTARYGGKGWVQVATQNLETADLCSALGDGQFYSSTGVEFAAVRATANELSLVIDNVNEVSSAAEYTTTFIGNGVDPAGATVVGLTPSYRLRGTEQYVRAVVNGPGGKKAWIQPVFVRRQ